MLTKQPKKPKRQSLSTIKTRLDRKMSTYIRARDPICVTCNSRPSEDNGHYIRRGLIITRYNFINCNGQCKKCNGLHEYLIEPYRDFMIRKYGQEALDELNKIAHSNYKINRAWYYEQEAEIDRRMEDLNG